MKSAYELAMERLDQDSSESERTPLSQKQKDELAEIDAKYKAKIAEKEIFLISKIEAARAVGSNNEVAAIQRQLSDEKERLEEECELQKDSVRNSR